MVELLLLLPALRNLFNQYDGLHIVQDLVFSLTRPGLHFVLFRHNKIKCNVLSKRMFSLKSACGQRDIKHSFERLIKHLSQRSKTFYTSGQARTTSASFSFRARMLIPRHKSLKRWREKQETKEEICCQHDGELRPQRAEQDITLRARAAGNERTERDDFIKSGRLV